MTKKAMLALEALIGTILGVIALLFVFQTFISIFYINSTNLDIAQANAESIKEFVNFFEKNSYYSSLTNCYNILKLENLQYIQVQGQENFYFYIIDNQGVSIYPISQYENLITLGKDTIEKSKIDTIYFENEISINTLDIINSYLTQTSENIYFVVAYTKNGDKHITLETYGINSKLISRNNYNKEKLVEQDFSYLLYKQDSNELFIPQTQEVFNYIYISNSLCANKYFQTIENNAQDSYANGVVADYITNNLYFSITNPLTKEEIVPYSFSWENNKAVCRDSSQNNKNIDCTLLLDDSSTYQKFITSIENYIVLTTSLDIQDIQFSVESKEKTTKELQENIVIVEKQDLLLDSLKEEVYSQTQEAYAIDKSSWFNINKEFQLTSKDESQIIFVENNKAYFYISDTIYQAFQEQFLRKDSYLKQVYFNGNLLTLKEIFELENSNEIKQSFYWYTIDSSLLSDTENLDILLTKQQYLNIREVKK